MSGLDVDAGKLLTAAQDIATNALVIAYVLLMLVFFILLVLIQRSIKIISRGLAGNDKPKRSVFDNYSVPYDGTEKNDE